METIVKENKTKKENVEMKEKTKLPNASVEIEEIEEAEEIEEDETPSYNYKTYKEICDNLVRNGGKRFDNIQVKNITVEEKDDYNDGEPTSLSFTLKSPIPKFVLDKEDNQYKDGMDFICYTSVWAFAAMLKEYEDLAWLSNTVNNNPKVINGLFNGSKINIISVFYAAGEEIRNPFGSGDKVYVYDHDTYINYIVGVKMNSVGKNFANMVFLKQAGF